MRYWLHIARQAALTSTPGRTSLNKLLRSAVLACIALVVAGCGQGLDKTPDLTSIDKYRSKSAEDLKEVPTETVAAYNWAVSDQTVDSLRATYSHKSYREIAKAEIDREIAADNAAIPALQSATAKFDPIVQQLQQVHAVTSDSSVTNTTMETVFSFVAEVKNGSNLNFSSLVWEARLYLDGSTTPVAKAALYSTYDSSGGLTAGATSRETMRPDTFFSQDWITLASKEAKERRIVLTLQDARDFNNKSFLDGAPYADLSKRKAALASAQKYKKILET